jgi:hypothetical protein
MKTTDKVEPITKKAFNGGNYVDPNVALIRYFHVLSPLISVAFDSDRKMILRTLAVEVLKEVRSLLEFDFWDSLLFDPKMPSHILPDASTRETRRELIENHISRVSGDSSNCEDVAAALNFTSDVVEGLNVEFSNGVMPAHKPVPDDQRFYCAAIIPALTQLFAKVWMQRRDPLRERTVPAGRRPWLG